MTDKEATRLFLFGGGCYYRDGTTRCAVVGKNDLLGTYTLVEENGTQTLSDVYARDLHFPPNENPNDHY